MSSTPPPPPGYEPPPPGYEPPPPPPGATPPPPVATPPPAWSGGTPAAPPVTAYEASAVTKPPRPKVQIAAILGIVGGALLVIGAILPWLSGGGETANGFDDYIFVDDDGVFRLSESPGTAWVVIGVILAGLSLALLLAGRVLAVAIIAIVMAGIALAMVGTSWAVMAEVKNDADGVSFGVGLFVGLLGGLAGLAGAIAATAKRRRAAPALT